MESNIMEAIVLLPIMIPVRIEIRDIDKDNIQNLEYPQTPLFPVESYE